MNNVTHAEVRMYKMGTGDCFVVKFFSDEEVKFKMMIDGGAIYGTKARLSPYVEDLKAYVDNHINALVITHEHQDHVLAFEKCKSLFTSNFIVDQIWMGWTENDSDPKVERWKEDYGEKKAALKLASDMLDEMLEKEEIQAQFADAKESHGIKKAKRKFASGLREFSNLHVHPNFAANTKVYKGLLAGMRVVKKDIASDNIQYFKPGNVLQNVVGLDGVKIYVLGPPELYEDVKKEHGGEGESYDRNFNLRSLNAFTNAVYDTDDYLSSSTIPFSKEYIQEEQSGDYNEPEVVKLYNEKEQWRRIDIDWLYAAGDLALRMNSYTNNLSLVLAIEFEESGKVMLFPGDAEYGSWASWHDIDWGVTGCGEETLTTEELLRKTVFYKIAHHLSHNGTAKQKGLEMMTHRDLAAMATVDYDVIRPGWKNTMPNENIVDDLLQKTKGRLLIMNEDRLEHRGQSITDAISAARNSMSNGERTAFDNAYEETELFIQYTVMG